MLAPIPSLKSDQPTTRLHFRELVDLLTRFQSEPDNHELEEALDGACLVEIRKIIEAYVYAKRFPNILVDEAMDSVQHNFTSKLRKVKSPGALKAWLITISRRAVIGAFRDEIIGRGKDKRVTEPLEMPDLAGKSVEILNLKTTREAAERHQSMMGSAAYADFAENVETRQLLCKLLEIHAQSGKKRDRDSAFWLQTMLVDGISKGEPIDEIARVRGTTRDDVLHLLKHDSRALHNIYRKLCGLT